MVTSGMVACTMDLYPVTTLLCSTRFADQIALKNGDRLTGTIIESSDKRLVIKTDYVGEVTVQCWSRADEPLPATPHYAAEWADGRRTVTTADGNIEVATNTGKVEAAKDSVVTLRNAAEQRIYDK